MSKNTKIEWADHTFNPWIGCTKVGPGCDNCYAKTQWEDRRHRVVWGAGQPRSRTKTWGDPVKWDKEHSAFFSEHGRRQRVFCASLADVFDNEVPTAWRMDLFELIAATPNLDWLILTKRIGNVMPMCSGDSLMFDLICERVWLGATICNQEEADRDIPKLMEVPAARRFLSMEPLLGPVDLTRIHQTTGYGCSPCDGCGGAVYIDSLEGSSFCFGGCDGPVHDSIDWVIVGGESGPNARPMHPDWTRSLRDQCHEAGVPFFFKQWGQYLPVETDVAEDEGYIVWAIEGCGELLECRHKIVDAHEQTFASVGKKAAGRLLDGREWNEVPT